MVAWVETILLSGTTSNVTRAYRSCPAAGRSECGVRRYSA
jgi:hypothetical protein